MKSRPCPTPGCTSTCRRRPICPTCWELVEGSCMGKRRHPSQMAAAGGISKVGKNVYWCALCETWHSGGARPEQIPAIRAAVRALATALGPAERAELLSQWHAAVASPPRRRHRRRPPAPEPLSQPVVDPVQAERLLSLVTTEAAGAEPEPNKEVEVDVTLDRARVPHEPSGACDAAGSHCYIHNVDEPNLRAYLVCMECGHVYQTARALRGADRRTARLCGIPWWQRLRRAKRIYSCPVCAHDF